MLSETFLARQDASSRSQPQQKTRHLQSPVNSYEDWKLLEGVAEWPCAASNEFPSNLDPDTVLGPLEEIKKDFETHSPWGAVFLNGVEKRLEEMERTLDGLANHFLIGSTAHEGEAGGQPVAKGMTFLTELRDQSSQRRQRLCPLGDTASNEDLTLDTLVYPGIGGGCSAVALPGTLDPLTLLDKVTKTALLPLYVQQCWQKLFHSGASCCLLQNTFWYVWLSYFKAKPDPNDLSRLFRLISENFMSLHCSILGGQKHKDEAFIHLPGCLAKAVYSAFCHSFPQSSKVFNSEEFLSYLTNLTHEWITGVAAPLGSWKNWPRHLLDPHFNSVLEDTSSDQNSSPTLKSTFSEKDVMRLSIKDKPRSVRLSTVSGAIQKIRRTRSSHTAPSRAKTPSTNPDKNEGSSQERAGNQRCSQETQRTTQSL
ncbi:Protein FAM227B [Geodia barretti]|uniref:Protein FAM227B n=1 Tax=Geodia barretti TaxID=519541 RepID=A0AA35RG75_GEOBA|nr:Protein FAM227B [Geodia barretti]